MNNSGQKKFCGLVRWNEKEMEASSYEPLHLYEEPAQASCS